MAKKKSEKVDIKSKQLSLEFAHPTQPRSKYFGEELQMDGCLHRWFDGIHTIEEANKYISKYLKKFNNQFALPINNTKSVFTNQLEEKN
jgi:hypothetical protein